MGAGPNFPACLFSSLFAFQLFKLRGGRRGYRIWGLRVFGSVLMVEWKMPFTVAGQTGKGRLPCHASVSSPILHSTRLACGCFRPLPEPSRSPTRAQSSSHWARTHDSASTTAGSSSTSQNAKRLSLPQPIVIVLSCWASWLWLYTSTVKGE